MKAWSRNWNMVGACITSQARITTPKRDRRASNWRTPDPPTLSR
jgi:hypothetical protein